MKKIILIICCLLLFVSGCKQQEVQNDKQDIIINLPTDNTVNGYRSETHNTSDLIPDSNVDISSSENKTIDYCGNKNSKVFHKSDCGSVKSMKDTNKVYFSSRDEYTQNGYTPCKKCNP